jgi:hypothetical protein
MVRTHLVLNVFSNITENFVHSYIGSTAGFPLRRPGFDARPGHARFVVDNVVPGLDFLNTSVFPANSRSTNRSTLTIMLLLTLYSPITDRVVNKLKKNMPAPSSSETNERNITENTNSIYYWSVTNIMVLQIVVSVSSSRQCLDSTSIRPWPLPSKSFPIHHSSIIPPFDVT